MHSMVFSDVMPRSSVNRYQCFGGTFCSAKNGCSRFLWNAGTHPYQTTPCYIPEDQNHRNSLSMRVKP